MASIPEYQRQGWRTAGPGLCRCPHCGTAVSTNALARASHMRACAAADDEPSLRDVLQGRV